MNTYVEPESLIRMRLYLNQKLHEANRKRIYEKSVGIQTFKSNMTGDLNRLKQLLQSVTEKPAEDGINIKNIYKWQQSFIER